MRRRGFITLLGARPVATHTQQRNPIPPITPWWGTENDPQANARQHPLSPARDSVGSRFGGHAMKTNGTDMRLAITVLALGVSLIAIPTPLWAQKTASIARVGWLEVCSPGPRRPNFDMFRARLAEQGYVEGKNLIIEQRFADCKYDRLPALAAELKQVSVDVLFTMGTRATRLVAEAVKDTPIVAYSCDPFAHVERLARPGGNLTGITCMTTELMPKRLELLKELIPSVSRVMFVQDPEAATNAFKLAQQAAPRLGVQMQVVQLMAEEDLLPELTTIAKERPDALLVYPDVVLSSYPRPQQLGDFALKAKLPTMHAFRFYVDAGGLMSYGATTSEIYTSAAEQVAKILGDTRPGDLPLRQATRFELVINLKTAKALGIDVPPSLLARADAVIE
jgi:putative tryptophan/tyrosine transport system substrate-binding protein